MMDILTDERIKELLREWNIEGNPIRIYHTAWDINDTYVLKAYDDRAALQRNITMMKILYDIGIPVPRIMAMPDGREYLDNKGTLYLLTGKLRGKNEVKMNNSDDCWFFQFGTILAELHRAFRKCEKHLDYLDNSLLEEMKGWVSSSLDKYRPEYLEQTDVRDSIRELAAVYDDLPRQLIHRDVHLGNFLFDKGEFSGYIDFDLSQRNIRIFDLCYFLLGILVKEDEQPVSKEKWYGIIKHVIKGYDSATLLEDTEKKAVACVMKNIELLFAAYFLEQGNEKLAKDAVKLFYFVKENEDNIQGAVV